MQTCPRCQQPIKKKDAIVCPFCKAELKAHGHPGIPLHRATGKEPLCRSCTYHADKSCNYPQYPDAWECTMYRDHRRAIVSTPTYNPTPSPQAFIRRNGVWFVLIGLVIFSFWVASANSRPSR